MTSITIKTTHKNTSIISIHGLLSGVFKLALFNTLKKTFDNSKTDRMREHVTFYITENPKKFKEIFNKREEILNNFDFLFNNKVLNLDFI
jgi:spore coat polysaccharide biosynthesis protein SpsF (cytidylyltransferase family)